MSEKPKNELRDIFGKAVFNTVNYLIKNVEVIEQERDDE